MGQGLYIDLNDGRPAMEITSGLRAPSYCGSFGSIPAGTTSYTFTMPTCFPGGSDGFFFSLKPATIKEVYPTTNVCWISNVTKLNSTQWKVDFGYANGPGWEGDTVLVSGLFFEIGYPSNSGAGLYIRDSTDFTTITTNSNLLCCTYAGNITFTGTYNLPSGTMVAFGRWDDPNVVVERSGNTIKCTRIALGSNYVTVDATVNMDLVVFRRQTPAAGNAGLVMRNASGQVVFSTAQRPFVFGGTFNMANGNQYIGNAFVPIARYGALTEKKINMHYYYYYGAIRSGGYIRPSRGSLIVARTNGRDVNAIANINYPLLPAMY